MNIKETIQNKFPPYAPRILRIGIALVFLWFGYQQLVHNEMWTIYVPDYVVNMSGISASALVTINGTFELIFGSLLLLGLFTRISALLLTLHMAQIMLTVGYSDIGVRDFGISVAAFSVFLYGRDRWCLDRIFGEKTLV